MDLVKWYCLEPDTALTKLFSFREDERALWRFANERYCQAVLVISSKRWLSWFGQENGFHSLCLGCFGCCIITMRSEDVERDRNLQELFDIF